MTQHCGGAAALTVWFTDAAIAACRAEPRTTPGGQPHYSALAITTALTMRTVFGLALRQTEGLIGSVVALLGLALAVPDHSTLSRRSKTLEVPPRRSWRKMHIGIVNSVLIVRAVSREGRQGIGELVEQRVSSRSVVALFLGQLDRDDFTAPAITKRSPSVIRIPRSSCRREQPRFRVRPPRPLRHSGTDTSRRSSRMVGWAGKSRVATIFGPRSRQRSVDTNA